MVIEEVAGGRYDKDESARVMFADRMAVGRRIHPTEKRNNNVVSELRDSKSYSRDWYAIVIASSCRRRCCRASLYMHRASVRGATQFPIYLPQPDTEHNCVNLPVMVERSTTFENLRSRNEINFRRCKKRKASSPFFLKTVYKSGRFYCAFQAQCTAIE